MTALQQFLDMVFALRWVLVVIGFVALGGLYADALVSLSRATKDRAAWIRWADDLERENAQLRRRPVLAARAAADTRRGHLVALPPRKTEAGR